MNVSQSTQRYYGRFDSLQACNDYEDSLVRLAKPDCPPTPFFTIKQYASGETIGSYRLVNGESKSIPPKCDGERSTDSFRLKSRQKIRRAVENSAVDFNVFLTLTFAPGLLQPWHFEEQPWFNFVGPMPEGESLPTRLVIRHDFAKYKLMKFRMALTQKFTREVRKNIKHGAYMDHRLKKHDLLTEEQIETYINSHSLRFIWAAELQDNGNIHFHIMLNRYIPIAYMSKLWGQAKNSVDVEFMKDATHAANYISQYITADDVQPIKGNRYNISRRVRQEAKPVLILTKENQEAIVLRKMAQKMAEFFEQKGGRVIGSGFGVVIPRPRKSRPYKAKDGTIKRTHGFSGKLSESYVDACFPTKWMLED